MHIELGVRVLATLITPEHPLQAILAGMPEVFLYGGLAPDIVQGRRLQSRMRRHSHNWSTGVALLESAKADDQRAFAYGYLSHLAADVVAHNFFLPARYVGYFRDGIASHIYNEACFDTLCADQYNQLLVKIVRLNFRSLDAMLRRAIDSPLLPFGAHRRVFESGLKRISQWHRMIRATGGMRRIDRRDAALYSTASHNAIAGVIGSPADAPCCRFDPMGAQAIRHALSSRRHLQRLTRLGPEARASADRLAAAMLAEIMAHLKQTPFGGDPKV